MGKEIDLKKGELNRHVSKALKAISDGYIIAIPLEHSYAFVCDAFKPDAVRAMHVLRGDSLFTAAQVLVGSTKTAQGVVREVTPEISALMKKFWPGMLSMNLRPQTGLSWDLGDDNQLDRISIRVPKSKFAKALVTESGPLAVASAVRVGRPIPKELNDIFVRDSDLAFQFNNGLLRKGPATTVVEADNEGVRVLRVGAISLEAIQEIVPGATGL
jgi:tRNA threonylcarbamoyl adenosine modification protein (Sua5/YciO/YrdC/YwlC family)